MHELQESVRTALDRQVGAFHEFRKATVGLHQIVAVALGMRRRETDPIDALDGMNGLDELDEGAAAVLHRVHPAAIAGDDLAEQSDLADPA